MSQSRRNVLFGILGVVAVIAACFFFFTGRGGVPRIGNKYTVHGICLACRHEGESQYPRDERPPHKCTQCGEQAVYPLYFCRDCKHRFVPHLVRTKMGDPLRIPENVWCPNCGSTNWIGFIPKLQPEEPVGDAPWPEWPG
ncbi:MAG: hypothetical protein KAY37_01230 [Phycisphaerae bacterium]|nr:hypothetical protein [Phycisphaerae bacterium]